MRDLLDIRSGEPKPIAEPAGDLQSAYADWKASPGPEANANMLKVMDPAIRNAARSQIGDPSPLMLGKAKTIALQSLNSYDPAKGKLTSHLYNHMQGLKRYAGQMTAGVRIPERQVLDRRSMDASVSELTAELGREPTDDELADRTGFSHKRLQQVRRLQSPMTSGFFSQMGDDASSYDPAVKSPASQAWLNAVYGDLDPLAKKVFEYSLGHNGQPVLQNQEIAKKLNRSPGWVSQQKQRIQQILDSELNPF